MFAFITRLQAKPGKRDALIALNRTMQDATATEVGVPVYIFHTAEDDPDAFFYYDLYESEEAYNAHCSTEAFSTMLASLGELADVTEMTKLIPFGPVKSHPLPQQ
ncbi:MAG: antibiotic biosynthesis monooxygenase [Halioglobus sp.]